MDWQGSCGVIPLRKRGKEWDVLLIQHKNYEQYWTCPKGHMEVGETLEQAACRELLEETGLRIVRFLQKEPVLEEFWMERKGEQVRKKILFFFAEVEGKVVLQKEEVAHAEWFPLQKAIGLVSHVEGRATLHLAADVVEALVFPGNIPFEGY